MRIGPGRLPAVRTVQQAELQVSIFLRAGDMSGGRPLMNHEISVPPYRAVEAA